MANAVTMLHEKYQALCQERQQLLDTVNERVLGGGAGMDDTERQRSTALARECEEAKEQWESQRDLAAHVDGDAGALTTEVERELGDVRRVAEEATETNRQIARQLGHEALEDYDRRNGEALEAFQRMSNGERGIKLTVNPHLARNFKELQAMGVSASDYVSAIRSGSSMIATRNADGNPDVRVYTTTGGALGAALVPSFWDSSLYEFASYIGGVQNSGAEVVTVMSNNAIRFPRVTAYASAMGLGTEGAAVTTEYQNQTDTITLTPRPYRGISIETDEIKRAAAIDVRMLLVIRGLARALQLGKETHFHTGTGSTQPTGILHSPSAGRVTKTGADTTDIRYADIPAALGLIDAEYHMDTRPGAMVTLMHSASWFRAFVGNVISFSGNTGASGMPLYPHLAQGSREIFGTRLNFSSLIASAVAANAYLAVVGNFRDAYLIATMGGQQIEVSDDANFTQWESVYRIQEYCDGNVRDNRAVAYIQSAD